MAVYREPPRCLLCGKIIAREIHKDYKNYPLTMIPIGDSFERWEYIKHKCKKKLRSTATFILNRKKE